MCGPSKPKTDKVERALPCFDRLNGEELATFLRARGDSGDRLDTMITRVADSQRNATTDQATPAEFPFPLSDDLASVAHPGERLTSLLTGVAESGRLAICLSATLADSPESLRCV